MQGKEVAVADRIVMDEEFREVRLSTTDPTQEFIVCQ